MNQIDQICAYNITEYKVYCLHGHREINNFIEHDDDKLNSHINS